MTEDEFNVGVRNIPLLFERDTTDGKASIYRKPDGDPVYVKKPQYILPEDRVAALEFLKQLYGPALH
jgi:hypothetical protein